MITGSSLTTPLSRNPPQQIFQHVTQSITTWDSTLMLPPAMLMAVSPAKNAVRGHVKEIDEGNRTMGGRKHKRNSIGNGDGTYQDHDDLTAQKVVQQVISHHFEIILL
jgi:hypothetical protein